MRDPLADRLRHLLEITVHLRDAIDELLTGLTEQIEEMRDSARARSRRRSRVMSKD